MDKEIKGILAKDAVIGRRDFLKAMGIGFASTAITGCSGVKRSKDEPHPNKPNIILIMADDLGYECIGCYGGTSYETPVLDNLAKSGMRFQHCYSQPLCTPSRVKIMTGQSNIRNYSTFGILNKEEKTFAHMLQKNGYKTAISGKWQLYGGQHYRKNLIGKGTHPKQAAFDEYCLWQVDERQSRYFDPLIEMNGSVLSDIKDKYGPDIFCDFIKKFIRKHKSEPFFIYYPMVLVHDPFEPTPDSENRQSKDKAKNFADMVKYMDRLIGSLVSELDNLGLREKTLILFTGDNGTNKSIVSNMGKKKVKGGKSLTTDAGTRVPLIANCPGIVPAGRVCDDLIDFSDFMPTIADMSQAQLPENGVIDGHSFWPQLQGKKGVPRESLYCYYNPRPGRRKFPERRFARDKRWKLYGNGQLYDIQNDVLEQQPIAAGQGGGKASRARKKLQKVLDSMPAKPEKISY